MNERVAPHSSLPAVALALGVLVWDLVVRINDLPPYILPGPGLVLSTLVADWADPVDVAARDARDHSRRACARGGRRRGPRDRCSTSRG